MKLPGLVLPEGLLLYKHLDDLLPMVDELPGVEYCPTPRGLHLAHVAHQVGTLAVGVRIAEVDLLHEVTTSSSLTPETLGAG